MDITIKVKKATVVIGNGPDYISLLLDMPTTYPSLGYDPIMKIETAPGLGVAWCKDNLGIEPDIINIPCGVKNKGD